jgi:glycosyltransferase involved in cell wall biosynthesis
MCTDPSSSAPEVSVIVPHFEQPEALVKCLASLRSQSLSAARYEVIVIDNNSVCDLSEMKKQFPEFVFLYEAEKGAAHARNAGLDRAAGKVIAFIDADCIADPNWLETGLEGLKTSDLAGGEVRVMAYREDSPTAVEAFECVFAFRQRMYINRKHFAVTANLFATRSAADAIGPFHNGVAEDLDWCLRARALGFRLAFNGRSIVGHPARRTWDELTLKWDRLIQERWNGFGGRSLVRRLGWAGLAVATVFSAAPHLAAIVFSRRIQGARNKIAAAGVLTRLRIWRAQRMLALLQV